MIPQTLIAGQMGRLFFRCFTATGSPFATLKPNQVTGNVQRRHNQAAGGNWLSADHWGQPWPELVACTGDYGLLDKVLEEGSGTGNPDSVGAFDPFGVFARGLADAVGKERDQPVDPEACPPILGELQGSESNNPVAGEEQRSGVQRDVQTEVQGSGSDI